MQDITIVTPEQAALIKEDMEFKKRINPLTPDEFKQLKENIQREGCREPITTWGDLIVDGHHRYDICTRLGIPFRRQPIEFASREEALRWIDLNQLGRRNLTADQKKLLVGRWYNNTKPAQGGTGANQSTDTKTVLATSAKAFGKRVGMSESGVWRAAEFAKVVDADPEMAARVMRGDKVANAKPKKSKETVQAHQGKVGAHVSGAIDAAVNALESAWAATHQGEREQFIARFSPSPVMTEFLWAIKARYAEKSQNCQIDSSAESAAMPKEAPAKPVEAPVPTAAPPRPVIPAGECQVPEPPPAESAETTVIPDIAAEPTATPQLREMPAAEPPLPVPAADNAPLVALAKQIRAERLSLDLGYGALGNLQSLCDGLTTRDPQLRSSYCAKLLKSLRSGNARAKQLADQLALHAGGMYAAC